VTVNSTLPPGTLIVADDTAAQLPLGGGYCAEALPANATSMAAAPSAPATISRPIIIASSSAAAYARCAVAKPLRQGKRDRRRDDTLSS
jgi:hypothetical protein